MLHFYWRLTLNFRSDGELPEWRVGACLTHFCFPGSAQGLGPSSREAQGYTGRGRLKEEPSGVVQAPPEYNSRLFLNHVDLGVSCNLNGEQKAR